MVQCRSPCSRAGCIHYESRKKGSAARHVATGLGEDLRISLPSWPGTELVPSEDVLTVKMILCPPTRTLCAMMWRYRIPSPMPVTSCFSGSKKMTIGTTKIEEWPSWTCPFFPGPIAGGVVGYAHSGWDWSHGAHERFPQTM